MQLNPIGIAVPFFFLLMAVEVVVSRVQRRRVYRFNDTIADLTCGMGDQLIGLVVKAATLAIYVAVFNAYSLTEWPIDAAWTWAVGIVGVDLAYYAYHRFSHLVNLGWATHVVHHQSEEYNLAVALRQPWFAQVYGWVFYVPFAVLGLPPFVYATSYALNLIYQFWIHTRLIDRLGPLEWVMNTPSHHRVHHGTDPEYVDKNYAGIFIIWDRMFGTFVEENHEPTYGTLKPLRSWNPLWANVGPIVALVVGSANLDRWSDKIRLWCAPPGWTPDGVEHPDFPSAGRGYDADGPRGLHPYVFSHLAPVSVATGLVIAFDRIAPAVWLAGAAIYIAWTGLGWAGMFERRGWALPMEISRLATLTITGVICAAAMGGLWWGAAAAVAVASGASGAWLWRVRAELRPAV